MGREVIRLQLDIHDFILNLRSVENTIKKEFFERLWYASTDEQKEEVRTIIMRGDKDALTQWMENHPDVDLGELSQNKLKKIAQQLHVINYCRLTRSELEDAIRERRSES